METSIAEQLERQILTNRAVFPCGCVLECRVHYPGRDWMFTGLALHVCEEHPYPQRRVEPVRQPSGLAPGELMRRSFPTPLQAPLEKKWLRADGTQLTFDEIAVAMEENLDRLDEEEEARITKHNAVRYRFEGIFGSFESEELWPKRVSRIDPHIVSQEATHAISRFGGVSMLPMQISNVIHDEVHLQVPALRPGDLIDLYRLQKKYTRPKNNYFGLNYGRNPTQLQGYSHPQFVDYVDLLEPSKSHNLAQAEIALQHFKDTWPALAGITGGSSPARSPSPPPTR